MLSSTAENLFWLSRYVERADNTARIIDAASRLAALPLTYGGSRNEWESAVSATGALDKFHELYDEATPETVIEFLAFSPDNPSSIKSCFSTARSNARAVRTALTVNMWEAINGAWLDLRRFEGGRMDRPRLHEFLNQVKEACLRFDGSAYRTMLRNDAYSFSRLGVYLERADNTARILDVKYHILLPRESGIGGGIDFFQWSWILRSVSALTAYHWVYRDSLKPWLVADLLVLNRQMPRSMASCYENVCDFLDQLAGAYGRQGKAQRIARNVRTRLTNSDINGVFQTGLHEFLEEFLKDNARVGEAIGEQYLL